MANEQTLECTAYWACTITTEQVGGLDNLIKLARLIDRDGELAANRTLFILERQSGAVLLRAATPAAVSGVHVSMLTMPQIDQFCIEVASVLAVLVSMCLGVYVTPVWRSVFASPHAKTIPYVEDGDGE